MGHWPVPPPYLIDRVFPLQNCTDEENANSFVSSGSQSLDELERSLSAAGRTLSEFHRLLDWGCGPGRVTLPLIDRHPHLDVTGVDPDEGSIDWLQSVEPSATFVVIQPEPPLPFVDHAFDVVVNHSVLTHIDEAAQARWLAEIARVLEPDGVFVTSVHGAHAFMVTLAQLPAGDPNRTAWLTAWQSSGFVFVREDSYLGSSHHDGYHSTFQDPATVEALSDFRFEPLVHLFRGDLGFQDQLVLRRRPDAEALARRELGAPRTTVDTAGAVGSPAAAPTDDPTARLQRSWEMASLALTRVGNQIARLEEAVGRIERHQRHDGP